MLRFIFFTLPKKKDNHIFISSGRPRVRRPIYAAEKFFDFLSKKFIGKKNY